MSADGHRYSNCSWAQYNGQSDSSRDTSGGLCGVRPGVRFSRSGRNYHELPRNCQNYPAARAARLFPGGCSRPSADLPGCIAAWASSPVEIRPTLPASGRSPTVLKRMGKVVCLDCVLILTGRSVQCNPSRADFGKGRDERNAPGVIRTRPCTPKRNPVRRRIAFDRERNACFLVL